jgi:hypothetical protein
MIMLICAVIAAIAAGLRLINVADDRATAIGVLALALGHLASSL